MADDALPDEEFELEMSPLCQTLSADGKSVQVEIYRGGDDKGWYLEVVDEFSNSTVWEDSFATDTEALAEAEATIREEGIGALIGSQGLASLP